MAENPRFNKLILERVININSFVISMPIHKALANLNNMVKDIEIQYPNCTYSTLDLYLGEEDFRDEIQLRILIYREETEEEKSQREELYKSMAKEYAQSELALLKELADKYNIKLPTPIEDFPN